MPDFSGIQLVAAIIGALITAAASSTVTYFLVMNRKRVAFTIEETEDLTTALRQHLKVTLKLEDQEVENLNRAIVTVWNTGNASIANFEFDIEIPGVHKLWVADKNSADPKLREAIQIVRDDVSFDATFHVKLPFFNRREKFDILVFFDGEPDNCNVYCRMEELKWKARRVKSLREDVLKMLVISMRPS